MNSIILNNNSVDISSVNTTNIYCNDSINIDTDIGTISSSTIIIISDELIPTNLACVFAIFIYDDSVNINNKNNGLHLYRTISTHTISHMGNFKLSSSSSFPFFQQPQQLCHHQQHQQKQFHPQQQHYSQ